MRITEEAVKNIPVIIETKKERKRQKKTAIRIRKKGFSS